jgi:hypothetical protein
MIYVTITGGHARDNFSNQITDSDEACRSSELSVNWIVVNDIYFGSDKVIQWVHLRHKVLTHGQERLFCMVTSVSIHSFVEWLDTFSKYNDKVIESGFSKASEINRNDLLEYNKRTRSKEKNAFMLHTVVLGCHTFNRTVERVIVGSLF